MVEIVQPSQSESNSNNEHKKSNPKLLSKMAMIAAMSALVSPLSEMRHSLSKSDFSSQIEPSIADGHNDDFWSNLSCCSRATRKRKVVERWRADATIEPVTPPRGRSVEEVPVLAAWNNHIRSQAISSLIDRSVQGLRDGHQPMALSDGMAGVYMLTDSSLRRVAVFKPSDEEVGCDNNPKGYSPKDSVSNVRSGLEPGQSMFREVAASILDHEQFSGVPDTCLVNCNSSLFGGTPKTGSLQAFVESNGSAGDLGCSMFTVLDVQKIAMLDIRILNIDRHDGNILYRMTEGKARLIPIDHGCCLPNRLEVSSFEWCWIDWPQVKAEVHPDVKSYVAALDFEKDVALLEKSDISLSTSSLRVFRVMTQFLKKAVAAGLTLFEIASAVSRQTDSVSSQLEKAIISAKWRAAVTAAISGRKFEDVFVEKSNVAIDRLVQQLISNNS